MKPFCEIIVSDVLPGIRVILSTELSEVHGLTQVQISRKLGMTQPAISQYMRDRRGKNIDILSSNGKIMNSLKDLAKDIAEGDLDSTYIHKRICDICKSIREEGIICKLHEDSCPSLTHCDICLK